MTKCSYKRIVIRFTKRTEYIWFRWWKGYQEVWSVRKEGKEKTLAHTLNGSALALPRIVAAILETHQANDEIIIPNALHSYTGFQKITLW